MGKLLGISVGLFITLSILGILLVGLAMHGYHNLTKEKKVAVISFDKVPNESHVYMAHVFAADNDKVGDYKIYGNQWRMDAHFIKMKSLANLFGFDSRYTLDRIEGRYRNIKDENSKKHVAYKLEGHILVNIFPWLTDVEYGASTYKDISTFAKFRVYATQSGLIVRTKLRKKNLIKKIKGFFK